MTDRVIDEGNVAVVTGAASGIGLSLARRLVREGMQVALADVEWAALESATAALKSEGGSVLGVLTDVSDQASVQSLHDQVVQHFGAVHLLVNNAGVGGSGDAVWESPQSEWDWVLGVNLHGVLHGLRSFVPTLIAQESAHIVTTASAVGIIPGVLGTYGVSKHAAVALMEMVYFELGQRAPHVGVSLLCPSAVATRIASSSRNRPNRPRSQSEQDAALQAQLAAMVAVGRAPDEVAGLVVDGVRSDRFYILTDNEFDAKVRRYGADIVAGGPPVNPLF